MAGVNWKVASKKLLKLKGEKLRNARVRLRHGVILSPIVRGGRVVGGLAFSSKGKPLPVVAISIRHAGVAGIFPAKVPRKKPKPGPKGPKGPDKQKLPPDGCYLWVIDGGKEVSITPVDCPP
jgi:hypothetical protein